jgi:CRP-like cAMP-binding protein
LTWIKNEAPPAPFRPRPPFLPPLLPPSAVAPLAARRDVPHRLHLIQIRETAPMDSPLLMKLDQYAPFEAGDRQRLERIIGGRRETYAPRQDIVSEGDHVEQIHLVMSGMAARYKILAGGERQIMAFLIPGDLCDVEVFVLERMDHGICAISETVCALVPAATIKALLGEMTGLTLALWWSTMTDSAVLRERIVDHGRRDARQRLAHIFYELLIRYRVIGLAGGDHLPFPLTQEELADATGLTPVHVNRTLKQLRDEGLIALKGRVLSVLDPPRLKAVAGFNPNYLHLRESERQSGPFGAAPKVPASA